MRIVKLTEGKKFDMGPSDSRRVISPEMGAKNISLNYTVFAPGQAFTLHRHRGSEDVIVILEGNGKIRVEEKEHDITAGDVIYIPPGELHGVIAGDKGIVAFSVQGPPDPDLYRGVYLKNTR